jgi:hypothetical protein
MLGGQSAIVAASDLPFLLVLLLFFARVLLGSETTLGGQTREENEVDKNAKGGEKDIISQVTPLIEEIRNEINEGASCYNLPPVRSAIILPKRKDYELYPILLYIDGVGHPITKHLPPQDLLDAFAIKVKLWGSYLRYILDAGIIRKNVCEAMMWSPSKEWTIHFSYFPLELEIDIIFCTSDGNKAFIDMLVRKNKGGSVGSIVRERGDWDTLFPLFLQWYCFLQTADPEEIRRVVNMATL